jgi:hypothetical protein
MKKYTSVIFAGLFILALSSSCRKQLDLAPVSSVTDGNFWKTADQFDSFVAGVHTQFRSNNAAFQTLGEMRADIFATDPGTNGTFTGEATQGLERLWTQNLNLDNPGVSSFGGFYNNINQLNLLISKLNSTDIVTAANKNYYLGIAYGMRAFYYYQLYRSWGSVIIQTEPTSGSKLDISNLAKAASPAADVLALVKTDIDKSAASFGTDYSFRNLKSYWSKSATLMLKADVYLWTAHRGNATTDAATAKAALTEIQTNVSALQLLPKYSDVFATTTKGNNEMIFVSHYQFNEATISFVQSSFVPQSGLISNFYDSLANRQFSPTIDNWGGLLRAPVRIAAFRAFNDKDSRKLASIQPAYQKLADGTFKIAGCFTDKYQGEQNAGARLITNDFPIYRYADLLLMLAEAKVVLGESPATELNQVRVRAYGSNYDAATQGFPNQTIDANPTEAILQERFFEFVFEGKRWYDLRRAGNSFVYEHTTLPSSQAYALFWPVDRTTLTNNRLLVQTAGYASF